MLLQRMYVLVLDTTNSSKSYGRKSVTVRLKLSLKQILVYNYLPLVTSRYVDALTTTTSSVKEF